MKKFLHCARNIRVDAACWVVAGVLMIFFRQAGFFDRPTIQIIFSACIAIHGFRVLVPFAFGSRKQLAENAETIGTSKPRVARIFCFIATVAVFVGFITVIFLNDEVGGVVRLGGVLSVVAVGIVSLRKTRPKVQPENTLTTDKHAL